jgi:hypothetical protein
MTPRQRGEFPEQDPLTEASRLLEEIERESETLMRELSQALGEGHPERARDLMGRLQGLLGVLGRLAMAP